MKIGGSIYIPHTKKTRPAENNSAAFTRETNAGLFNAFLFAAISQFWVNIVIVAHAAGGEVLKGGGMIFFGERVILSYLGGGFKYFLFSPLLGGNDPI